MNNDEIRRNYECGNGPYQRPPVVPLPGMGRGYWRLMTLLGIVAAVAYVVAVKLFS